MTHDKALTFINTSPPPSRTYSLLESSHTNTESTHSKPSNQATNQATNQSTQTTNQRNERPKATPTNLKMHLTTLTALLLPLLLSSVLAAPTFTGHDNASNGALKVRQAFQCTIEMTDEQCTAALTKGCSNAYSVNNCGIDQQDASLQETGPDGLDQQREEAKLAPLVHTIFSGN